MMNNLMEAVAYETYADYCAPRREIGLGVIPESLFEALKEQEMNESVVFEDVDAKIIADEDFMFAMEHFRSMREELGYNSVWSIYDAGCVGSEYPIFKNKVRTVRYQFVRNDATSEEIYADLSDGGQRSMAEVTSISVNGTIGELWRAAESCIRQSGTHHSFIEGFDVQDDGSLMLITGS